MVLREVQKDHLRLMENLKLIQKIYGVVNLCSLLNLSLGTWYNRMREPWKYFSYDELRAIAKYCKVDFVQLVDGELNLK